MSQSKKDEGKESIEGVKGFERGEKILEGGQIQEIEQGAQK